MTVSLDRRLTLRALMEQAWQQVEGQATNNAEGAVKGLLLAERDRRVARPRAVARRCTAGLHRAQVLDHAVGQLRAGARSATARWKEIGLLERYERHGLDEVLFRSDRRRAEPTQGGGLGAAILRRDAFASDIARS